MFAYLNYLDFLFPSKIPSEFIRPIAALLQICSCRTHFSRRPSRNAKREKKNVKEMSAMLWREVMLGQ
jgi:hypothetical protein